MQNSKARILLVKTVLMLVAKVTRANVLGLELWLAVIAVVLLSAGVLSRAATRTACGLKPQPAMNASTVKIIMSTNTARDDVAAATKPPIMGPTMILTLENMAMAELMSLSSTGSSVR